MPNGVSLGAARRRHEQRAHHQNWPKDRGRRHRSELRRHTSSQSRRRPGRVSRDFFPVRCSPHGRGFLAVCFTPSCTESERSERTTFETKKRVTTLSGRAIVPPPRKIPSEFLYAREGPHARLRTGGQRTRCSSVHFVTLRQSPSGGTLIAVPRCPSPQQGAKQWTANM